MKVLIVIALICWQWQAIAQNKDEKVIIKYKEYEKIDLGDFSIQGDIITPGDLSVKERKNKFLNSDLYERVDFDDLNLLDGGQ